MGQAPPLLAAGQGVPRALPGSDAARAAVIGTDDAQLRLARDPFDESLLRPPLARGHHIEGIYDGRSRDRRVGRQADERVEVRAEGEQPRDVG